MKSNRNKSIFLFTVILFTVNISAQEFKKLSVEETDQAKVKIATDFGLKFMNALKSGSYYTFTTEATEAIKAAMTKEKQAATYTQMKDQFGEYQKAEYVETWNQTGGENMIMVRMRANFSLSQRPIELRIVLNNTNKIAGIWLFPWSDVIGGK